MPELLSGTAQKGLSWQIYLGYLTSGPYARQINELTRRIQVRHLGYGVYLGQRQFIANVQPVAQYSQDQFQMLEVSNSVDTAVRKDQVLSLDSNEYRIIMEMMPLEQSNQPQKSKTKPAAGRTSIRIMEVLVETSGQRINGSFRDVVQIQMEEHRYIAFL